MKFTGKPHAGFTLVEVLTGMGIFSIGILGSIGLISWMLRANAFNSQMVSANAVGQGKLEELRELGFDDATSGSAADGRYNLTWTTSSPTNGYKTISLTVAWQTLEGVARNVKLSNLVTDETIVPIIPDFAIPGGGGGTSI